MNKKIIKKNTFKPAYTVDITNCRTVDDMLCEFGLAKQHAGIPITDRELSAIVDKNSVAIIAVVHDTCERVERKPWYKRFWNWLFGKK